MPAPKPLLPQDGTLSVADLQRLVAYFKACVEEEGLRHLSLSPEGYGTKFIAPWEGSEPLFQASNGEAAFKPSTKQERDFVSKSEYGAAGSEAFYYGYPLVRLPNDKRGRARLVPLFFVQVELDTSKGDAVIVRQRGEKWVNHLLYRERRYTDEELEAIRSDLEGDFGSLSARMEAAVSYLKEGARVPDVQRLTRPDRWDGPPGWVNAAVVFRSDYGPYSYNLLRDLGALQESDGLLGAAFGTALGRLLNPQPWDGSPGPDPVELLPLNEAQEQAARMVLAAPLTVVTGPPGTGKSQVVVDLLASAIRTGQTVLFASKNNKAVDVVRDRLSELLGDADFSLRLGRKELMKEAHDETSRRLRALAAQPAPRPGAIAEAEKAAEAVRAGIETVRTLKRKLDEAETKEREREADVPTLWIQATQSDFLFGVTLPTLGDHLERARALAGETRLGFVLWVQRLLLGGWLRRRLAERLEEDLAGAPRDIREDAQVRTVTGEGLAPFVSVFRDLIAYRLWLDARTKTRAATGALVRAIHPAADYPAWLAAQKAELARHERTWCRLRWKAELISHHDAVTRDLATYFNHAAHPVSAKTFTAVQQKLARALPIWAVVNLSARNALPLTPNLFDLVVIDEASQCDLASALPLLFRARRAAVIGDPMQLGHITQLRPQDETRLAQKTRAGDLLPRFSYRTITCYRAAEAAWEAFDRKPLLLNEHYRCHPAIITFSNARFYGGRLHIRTDERRLAERIHPCEVGIFWHDVKGEVPPTTRSAYNQIEVAAIVALVGKLIGEGLLERDGVSLGVVTPFRPQADRIKQALNALRLPADVKKRIVVGTAYAFQGDECDVMVLSTVVARGIRPGTERWAATTRPLLNVAVTRARSALHIVGDREHCRVAGGHLAALVEHVEMLSATASP